MEYIKKILLFLFIIISFICVDIYLFDGSTSPFVLASLSLLTVENAYIKVQLNTKEENNAK